MTVLLDPPTEVAPLLGSTTPRLYTRPLVEGQPGPCGCGCALTSSTSLGFAAVKFAEEIIGPVALGGKPGERALLPWQRWWLIHALELLPGGRLRFKTLLLLISRQNGKSRVMVVLALFLMYLRGLFVVGAAQNLTIAAESWQLAVDVVRQVPDLDTEVGKELHRYGAQLLTLTNRAAWRVAAATRSGSRGLSGVDLLFLDELREQTDWEGWAALTGTTTARPDALTCGVSNAGDDESVVLNTLRAEALAGGDETLGVFEWSGPDGCELSDRDALAQANPGLGYTIDERTLCSKLAQLPPAKFRAEHLCQRVDALDAAIDIASWRACADEAAGLESVRERVAVCVSVAEKGHVTLVGAGVLADGRVRVLVGRHWPSTEAARQELPALLDQIQPAVSGWYPSGPGAVLSPELRPLGAVELVGVKVTEACQGLSDLVVARRILQPGDADLDVYVARAKRKRAGQGWRFAEWGPTYAIAGAVWLARTLPAAAPELPRPRIF